MSLWYENNHTTDGNLLRPNFGLSWITDISYPSSGVWPSGDINPRFPFHRPSIDNNRWYNSGQSIMMDDNFIKGKKEGMRYGKSN